MKLSHALILALLLTFALYNSITLLTIKEMEREQVTIERVIDGDTLTTTDGRTIRLVNINAPEKNSPLAQAATTFMKQYEGKEVELEVLGTDKYHRLLGRIYGAEYLNLALVQQGLASIFLVQEDELTTFAQAEKRAVEEGRRIWQHAPEYGCITLDINPEKEYVTITCTCYQGSMKDWYLKDESRKTYKFTGACIHTTLWSESAEKAGDLSWGVGNVWNNDRDTAYLFSEKNELVARVSYGYPR